MLNKQKNKLIWSGVNLCPAVYLLNCKTNVSGGCCFKIELLSEIQDKQTSIRLEFKSSSSCFSVLLFSSVNVYFLEPEEQ